VTEETEVVLEAVLGEAFARLLPHLDERQRRLALGAAARVLGYGGIRRVARVSPVRCDRLAVHQLGHDGCHVRDMTP
jgi:hypothetical protein